MTEFISWPGSPLATQLLTGLKGIEIGAASHNLFGLDTINVDLQVHTPDSDYGKSQLTHGGKIHPVDVVAPGDCLPFADKSFDFVISSHVLEHFYDPIKAMREWIRVSRRYVFMIVPHADRTFDKERPSSTVQELTARALDPMPSGASDQHWSVWRTEDFLKLIKFLGLPVAAYQDVDDKVGNGFAVALGDLSFWQVDDAERFR